MSHLDERIRECLREQGARQARLVEATGATRATVSDWLSGETQTISTRYLFSAARFLGVTPTWLNTGKGQKYPDLSGSQAENVNILDNQKKIPILPWDMVSSWAKGRIRESGEQQTTWYARGGARTFAVQIQGESMTGTKLSFSPGELVHIDPDQTDLVPDTFVLAELTESGQTTFKQLKYEDGRYYLSSLNPHFPPIFDDFVVLGRAVAKTMEL